MTELCKILEATRESIGNNNMRYIRNYVRKVFSDINFTKTIFVDFKERQFPNIINNMELEDIVVERLEEWLDALSYESDSNPKQDYANSIKSENKKIVTPNRSIVRQVQGAWGYSVIMDAPVHSGDHTQADQITTVLRYHNFAKVEGLYYKDVESALMAYTKRKLLQDSLYENKIPSVSSNDISGFTLDDYMAVSEDMTAMLAQTYSRTQITFSDGTIVNIDGKVLQRSTDSEKWTLESLEDVEAPQGKEITYYLQDSSLFYRLFKIHLGLPNDGDIDTYSALWHDKLRDSLGDSEEKKLLFCEKVGISHLVLKNQLEGKSRFLRKTQKMLKALDILVSDGNISEEQKEYIMAARKCMNSESIAFGTKLKSALLNYRMNGTIDAELGRILDKAGMDIASLVEEFLFTKTIKSVNYGRYNG